MRPFLCQGEDRLVSRGTSEGVRGAVARLIGTRCLDFRGKDRLIRRLYHPDRIVGSDFTVDYFGKKYVGHTAEFVDWSVYVYGGAERAAIDALRRMIARAGGSWNFVDVGANAGTYCLPFADSVRTGIAFEPVSETRVRLLANLALNGISNITIESCALGSTETLAAIHYPSSHSNRGIASLLPRYNSHNDRTEAITVKPLDLFLSQFDRQESLFVKIDVEGTELNVLMGAETVRDLKVLMMIETVDREVLELLGNWGFKGCSITNDYSRLRRHKLDVAFENHILSNFIDPWA